LKLALRKFWPVLLCLGLCACSQQAAQTPPDAAALLLKIPAADSTKYNKTPGWHNPYLIVRPDWVGLISSDAPNEEQKLKPEEVLDVLSKLPASSWPYGRVVAVVANEGKDISEPEKVAVRRSRGIIGGELKSAQVEIEWVDPHRL
jgi:hypothetical protein